jgi:hypothetical protein
MGAVSIDDIDMKMLSIKLFKIRILIIKEPFKIETIDKEIFTAHQKQLTKMAG